MNKKQDRSRVLAERTTVRYTTAEYKNVKKKAADAGMSFSDFCRQMTIQGYVKAAPSPLYLQEIRRFKNMLLEYRTHFSRISNFIKNNDPSLNGEVLLLRNAIQAIIEKITI